MKPPAEKGNTTGSGVRLRGIPVSPGIAVGEVFLLGSEEFDFPDTPLAAAEVEPEAARFLDALEKTKDEIEKIRTRYRAVIGEELVRVFDAQLMIIQDETVLGGTLRRIRRERQRAGPAFQAIISEAIVSLSKIENEYLRDRAEDLKDVRRRVLHHLSGRNRRALSHLAKNVVVVADDLTPSETVQFPRSKVKGFATQQGGRTSHTAIMARSLQIPAVVGIEGIVGKVRHKDKVIVDGSEGLVVLRPDLSTLRQARRRQRRYMEVSKERLRLREIPPVTKDGVHITLRANVDVPEEVPVAVENRARGIGLFRTEFLYFRDIDMSKEEAQTAIYRKVLRRVSPEPVVFRTLDVGGDKVLDPLSDSLEQNPMLGWRGIRISLELRDLFRVQLRSLLRASTVGNLSILLPMITTIEEVVESKRLIAEVREELRMEGTGGVKEVRLGAMIETPAAVHLTPHLAKEVDFFSVGTNDLIQYSLAVDRDNVKVAHLFDPFHPAVAGMVRSVLDAGRRAGIPVSICGEMAGEPLCAILLVGLGARELSVHPYLIPELKRIFCFLDVGAAQALAESAVGFPSSHEVRDALETFLHDLEKKEAEKRECESGRS